MGSGHPYKISGPVSLERTEPRGSKGSIKIKALPIDASHPDTPGMLSARPLQTPGIVHRPSYASSLGPQNGPYWRTPATMVFAFVFGIGCTVALHIYYSSLNGTPVGNVQNQQTSLRIGTGLAFATQITLAYSIRIAHAQWLWHELRKRIMTFNGIDAGFAAVVDPLSFLNWEMLTKLKMASVLASVWWFLPVSTLIAPSTLNVEAVSKDYAKVLPVPTLQMSQAQDAGNFAFSVNGTNPASQVYLGPRTIFQRLSNAAASTGQILALPPPATNASYQQTFNGPYVQCNNSTSDVVQQMTALTKQVGQQAPDNLQLISLDYYAIVPALSKAAPGAQVQAADLTNEDGALNASNQLWIYIPQFEPTPNFTGQRTDRYLTCELYNASYTTQFSWRDGIQNIEVTNLDVGNVVPYPSNASLSEPITEQQMAFSSLMSSLSRQLTGSMGFYMDHNATNADDPRFAGKMFSDIQTHLAQTVLVGSTDFNDFFQQNRMQDINGNASTSFSRQRLQDMAYAGNNTLPFLISQLSMNITMNLFSDPSLSPNSDNKVNVSMPVNIYTYQSRNVLITYVVTGFIAFVANVLGLYIFYTSGVSHDTSFSSIACTTHDLHVSRHRVYERLGALPLDPLLQKMPLSFYDGEDDRWGWGAAESKPSKKGIC